MSEIRIEMNIEKRHLYLGLGLAVLLASIALALADVDKALPWHDASTIEVTVDGQTVSLQEALDQELIVVASVATAGHTPEADRAVNTDKVGGLHADELC
jgi:hypothetical protein